MNPLSARAIAIAFLWVGVASVDVLPEDAPKKPDEKAGIEQLIAKLGDEEYTTREAALEELVKIGKPAMPLLIQAVISSADAEVRLRSETALSRMQAELSDEEIGQIEKTIEAVEEEKTREALWRALQAWLGGCANGLRLVIRLDKKIYDLGKDEKIVVSARLKNQTKQDLCVCVGFNVSRLPKAHYRFEIEGADGKIQGSRMSSDFDLGEVREQHFVQIQPRGEHVLQPGGEWDLSGKSAGRGAGFWFGCLEQGDTSLIWEMQKPGRYKLVLVYRNDNDGSRFGLKAWTGEVRSNTVVLELK